MIPKLQQRTYVADEGSAGLRLLSPPYWFDSIRADLGELAHFRHVLRNFVVTDLKVRYQRSTLGFVWTLLNPILMMTVMAVIFSQVMQWKGGMNDYAIYLFSGFVPWSFFSACINQGSRCLLANEFLIKKVRVPKFLFPLRFLVVWQINLLFETVALFILALALGASFHVQLLLLPAGMIFLGVFTFGMVLISMTLVSRYRDFEHIIGVFVQAFYFLSPVLYTEEYVKNYPALVTFNPMAYILRFFHAAFYTGQWPDGVTWLTAGCVSLASLLIGYGVYKRCEGQYVFWL